MRSQGKSAETLKAPSTSTTLEPQAIALDAMNMSGRFRPSDDKERKAIIDHRNANACYFLRRVLDVNDTQVDFIWCCTTCGKWHITSELNMGDEYQPSLSEKRAVKRAIKCDLAAYDK